MEPEILKVSAKTNPNKAAGAIAEVVRKNGEVEIQTIGAAALNQAIKAVAIASGFIAPSGAELICKPGFMEIVIDGQERTAIRLIVRKM